MKTVLISTLSLTLLGACGESADNPGPDAQPSCQGGWESPPASSGDPLAYPDSAFAIHGSHGTQFNWFIQKMGWGAGATGVAKYMDWANDHVKKMQVHFTRSAVADWPKLQPTIGGAYDWKSMDEILVKLYADGVAMNDVVTFWEMSSRDPLANQAQFSAFVKTMVERYDGDGKDDVTASSPVKVKYWQIGNEYGPAWEQKHSRADYVTLVKLFHDAAVAADPDAKIVLIAQTPFRTLDEWWKPTVSELKGYLHAVDLHDWGNGRATGWKDWKFLETARAYLDQNGMSDVQIWSLENGTHAGSAPATPTFWAPYAEQSLADQARFLVKRITWSRAHGLKKLFWSFLIDFYRFGNNPNDFYSSLGFIGDGDSNNEPTPTGAASAFNARRPIYWAYQMLAQYTDTPVATELGEMSLTDGSSRYGYAYQLKASGRRVYVLWTEGAEQDLSFEVQSAKVHVIDLVDVDEAGTFGTQKDLDTAGGKVTVHVGANPVMVVESCG